MIGLGKPSHFSLTYVDHVQIEIYYVVKVTALTH